MTNIQKSQNIATLHSQTISTKTAATNFLYDVKSDKIIKTTGFINRILNVSLTILPLLSYHFFFNALVSWCFNTPISGYKSNELANLGFKTFIAEIGLIIPKYVVNYLENDRFETIFKSHALNNIDLQNSSIVLTDKKIKIINNDTNEKLEIKY